MDINYVMSALNTSKPTGWSLGKSKALVNSWELGIRVQNPTNTPVKVTLYTLKFKRDQNFEPGVSQTTSLRDQFELWFNSQYGTQGTSITIEYPAFKFSALAMFTKNIKIVRRSTRVLESGHFYEWRKFRKRPKLYNTATMYNPLQAPYIIKRALRGDLHYMFEIEPYTQQYEAGANIQYLRAHLNFLYKIHMRFSYFANDEYSYDPSTGMSSNTDNTGIMPTNVNTVGVLYTAAAG